MLILFQIIIAWFMADLVTGIVHWFEDKYMDANSLNFWARDIAEDNDLHHTKPTAMIINGYWDNMRSGAAVGWPLAALLWWLGLPAWIWLTPFFAAFGNLVHRFAHTPEHKLPRWIRGLQEFGIFISYDHHDLHHRSMKQLIPKHLAGYKFCPMTDWVNPVLDRLRFWQGLEYCLRLIGLRTTAEKLTQSSR